MDFLWVNEVQIWLGVTGNSGWKPEWMAKLQQATKNALNDVDAGRVTQVPLP
jgi:hypothetical protein